MKPDSMQLPAVKGLCALPHGTLSVTLILTSTVAWVGSIVAPLVCDFMFVFEEYNLQFENGSSSRSFLKVSYPLNSFCHMQDDGGFVPFYRGPAMYDAWMAARVVAFVAAILGFFAMAYSWLLTCIIYPRKFFLGHTLLFMVCAVLQGLTLIVLATDVCDTSYDYWSNPQLGYDVNVYGGECKLGIGAGLSIAACILWIVSAVCTGIIGFNCEVAEEARNEETDQSALLAQPGESDNPEQAEEA